jgi:hypothetical protein
MSVAVASGACSGAMPLTHGAHVLDKGDVRAIVGVAGQAPISGLAEAVRNARASAQSNPNVGVPGDVTYAKGALASALVGPGVSPIVGGRVGIGNGFEGGIAYTGRGIRVDARHAWNLTEEVALSLGVGGSTIFYGQEQSSTLPGVDVSSLYGYGADVPLLIGWQSTAGLYQVWGGVRGGGEHGTIGTLTSEPKAVSLGLPPPPLRGERWYGGALVGAAAGFRHVHAALQLEASYETVVGRFNGTDASAGGFVLSPSGAVWWTF